MPPSLRGKNDRSMKTAAPLEEFCPSLQASLEIETTTRCNMNPPCAMCIRNVRSRDLEEDMPDEVLHKLIPFLGQSRSLSLHGIGEPLMDARIFSILQCIDPLKTAAHFSTNGLLLDEERAEALILAGVREINFSFDAAIPETYELLRGKSLQALLENVKRLIRLKDVHGTLTPVISFSMVLMKQNVAEAEGLAALASEIGAQKIVFQVLNPCGINYCLQRGSFRFEYENQHIDIESEEVQGHLRAASHLCLNKGLACETFPGEGPDVPGDRTICGLPWENLLVSADGSVRFCCFMSSPLGSLKSEWLPDLWNGAAARTMRKELLRPGIPTSCVRCPRVKGYTTLDRRSDI